MKHIRLITFAILLFSFPSAYSQGQNQSKALLQEMALENTQEMNSFIAIFEIPATDLSRAITFYQTILDIKIEQFEVPGMEMGVFPYENQAVTGVIIKGEGYQPTSDGVTIYLNGGDDLQPILDKAAQNGGEILVPKTAHADNNGYFALFLDTEGNRLGLSSAN